MLLHALRTAYRASSVHTRFTHQFARQAASAPPMQRQTLDQPQRHKTSAAASPSVPPYELYTNPRRLHSLGLTSLAVGQAGFWASATNMSTQVVDPMFGAGWTVFGFSLSAVFALMMSSFLRRSVAHLHVLNGPTVRVVSRNLFGTYSAPVDIAARDLIAGRRADTIERERHWTFGVKLPSGRTFYYIVDMSSGVVDRDAIHAIAKGGEHFMAWSLKRDAHVMKQRWQDWRSDSPTHT